MKTPGERKQQTTVLVGPELFIVVTRQNNDKDHRAQLLYNLCTTPTA